MSKTQKKKGQTMSLNAFLQDEATGGSWADEEMDLPTQPLSVTGGAGAGARGGAGAYGDREGYRPSNYESKPLPTQPPYIAYVGNLGFDATEEDVEKLFDGLALLSVKFVRDRETNQFKGFGYVEFEALADLEKALAMSGEPMHGRALRIDVGESSRGASSMMPSGPWRRAEPLAPSRPEQRSSGGFGASDRGSSGGYGARSFGQGDRGSAFGERRTFTPASGAAGPPAERRPLQLKPRTVTDAAATATTAAAGSAKPSPFGAAKPVGDKEAEVLRRVEEKLAAKNKAVHELVGSEVPSSGPRAPRNGGDSDQENQASVTATKPAAAKPSPFGAAKPVGDKEAEVLRRVEEKLAAKNKAIHELVSSEAPLHKGAAATTAAAPAAAAPAKPAAPRAPRSNPFGAAKPVDQLKVMEKVEKKAEEEKKALHELVEKELKVSDANPKAPARVSATAADVKKADVAKPIAAVTAE